MTLVRSTYRPTWRRGFLVALLGLMGFILAACSGTTGPFGKEEPSPTATKPEGKTPPAIVVRSISGMPNDLARSLKVALAVSAGKRDIGIVEGALPGGVFALEGVFSAVPAGAGTQITYQWTLRDTKGYAIDQPSGQVDAPGGGADPWAAANQAVVTQIAEQTSALLAQKLTAMGYQTRQAALIAPPSAIFAKAGPGASKDIDYETLNGPDAVAAAVEMPDPSAPDPLTVASTDPLPEEQQQAKTASKSTGPTIKAVAVIPVSGAPGNGNAELAQAMRETLAAAGWPVVDVPRPDALIIGGKVKVGPAQGGQQTVDIAWSVKHPDGRTLGDIKQSNAIPAGSVDRGFGAAATPVAEAAATGIFDLIKAYR